MAEDQNLMVPLNLPKANLKLRRSRSNEIQVWEPIRKKWLILTPEEWVRMHVLYYFHDSYGVPLSRIQSELGFQINKKTQRCDLIILNKELKPYILVECKAPEVKINDAVQDQVYAYNYQIGAQYLMLTNGLIHDFYILNKKGNIEKINEDQLK